MGYSINGVSKRSTSGCFDYHSIAMRCLFSHFLLSVAINIKCLKLEQHPVGGDDKEGRQTMAESE